MDDLLSADIGKHDYDWLLTPPGTPMNSDAKEHQSSIAPRSISNVRSVSMARSSSRLSASHTENGHSSRPARSVSAIRPSISTPNSSSYLSSSNRTSALNTSSASVTSRPSTLGSRSTSGVPSSRASSATPASRPTASATRSSTPTRMRQAPISYTDKSVTVDKSRPAATSRPSTPTGRPLSRSSSTMNPNSNPNPNPLPSRPSSRSSTPTRRTTPAAPPTISRSTSVGRISAASGKTVGPASRPSSPAPRTQASVHPIALPDFPMDAPPNLRTKLPERPVSAGRARPGMALTVMSSTNTDLAAAAAAPLSSNRRNSSPVVSRGRLPENSTPKFQAVPATATEIKKSSAVDATTRKPLKPAIPATESTGFGRTISKKSMDMALRHMDIRQTLGSVRGSTLFPQSIRSAAVSKARPARASDPMVPSYASGAHRSPSLDGTIIHKESNGSTTASISDNGSCAPIGSPEVNSPAAGSSNKPDIYGSYRYDAILLKEDYRNMSWLHGVDDRSDESPEFDHRFGHLPEPFAPL